MSLAQIKLDDLTWAEMVSAIRRRIPADSDGQWTLHAPVDPGETLLELFAWLLEQRVYWLDQIPDSFVRTALRLLGAQVKPTQAAATVLQFSPASFRTLPARMEMGLFKGTQPIIFSTAQGVTLLPVAEAQPGAGNRPGRALIGLHIAGRDRTQDLQQGRELSLFPFDGSSSEIKIVLWLTEPLQHMTRHEPFALLFDLRTSSKIVPQWSPEAPVNVPPPAKIGWYYSTAAGRLDQFTETQVLDGTGGLRRSGVVQLSFAKNWEVDEGIEKRDGMFPYSIVLRVAKATFSVPPRLVNLTPNVVIAQHQSKTRVLSSTLNWRPLPGNTISFSDLPGTQPEKDYPPLETTVRLRLKERDGKYRRWVSTSDLALHGPGERVFVVDRRMGLLSFGDGLTGRLPVLVKSAPGKQSPNARLIYKVGGGIDGNVGSNCVWSGVAQEQQDLVAQNVVPGIGGAEAETIDEARKSATAELRKVNRAITGPDYVTIAETTKGVAFQRAHAAVGYHPGHPCNVVPGATTVFIVPEAPRKKLNESDVDDAFVPAPVPDPGSLELARARFEEARLLGSEVFVSGPRYRQVSLIVEVDADPVDPLAVRQRIKDSLSKFLDPLTGSEDGTGWPFGEPVRPSALLREAQQALGDEGEVVSVSAFLDGRAPQSSCADVPVGPHDLVTLQNVTVQLSRSGKDQEGLR